MITAQLASITEGLYYMSESDYPFDIIETDMSRDIINPASPTPEEILTEYLGNMGIENPSIEKRSLGDFFRNSTRKYEGMTEEELAVVERFQAVVDFLTAQCGENIEVFKLGNEPEKEVYIVGLNNEGEYIILKTKVVET